MNTSINASSTSSVQLLAQDNPVVSLPRDTYFIRQFHSIVHLYQFEKINAQGWVIAFDVIKKEQVNCGAANSDSFSNKSVVTDAMRNNITRIVRDTKLINNRDRSKLTLSGIIAIMGILDIHDGEFDVVNQIAFELAY